MLRPKVFLLTMGIILLVAAGIFHWVHTASFIQSKNRISRRIQAHSRDARNITVIFLDITDSDTSKAWMKRPFREQFVKSVNSYLASSQDVIAAYLIHGKTRDLQPFWTNYPLSAPPFPVLNDSASLILAGMQKEQCIQAFDSIAARQFIEDADATDSMLVATTDVFGALQQSALYFRAFATSPKDIKRVIFLSDTKENAGYPAKLGNISSPDMARSLGEAALNQVKMTTDITNELKYSDIHMLTPNNHLYYNDERNLRRIFWETLLIDKLHCNNVYYF